mgnify:FL=1|tara:strand:+ start:185 stop:517 length:333 start_codon:yes stop_codon:yes gene_type:complete
MSLTIAFLLIAVCIALAVALGKVSHHHFKKTKEHLNKMSSLERALANPEVVEIVNKMIRDPWVDNPRSHIEKRKNKRRILLRIRLKGLVPDDETRKMIYTFIHRQTDFKP